jgi:hypothetical protein
LLVLLGLARPSMALAVACIMMVTAAALAVRSAN